MNHCDRLIKKINTFIPLCSRLTQATWTKGGWAQHSHRTKRGHVAHSVSSRMQWQNIQHSPSMSLSFGWHQSNQGNAGSAYLETWWRVRIKCGGEEKMVWERNWQLDTTCINLWVFQSTSCLFMQFQDVSCRFHQFPRSLSRWNLRAMFVNNSTFFSAWNHLHSRRGTGIRHTMKWQNITPVKGIIHHDDTCWYCIDG